LGANAQDATKHWQHVAVLKMEGENDFADDRANALDARVLLAQSSPWQIVWRRSEQNCSYQSDRNKVAVQQCPRQGYQVP